MIVVTLIMEMLADKHILFVDGIAFSKGLGKRGHQMVELIIAVDVGRVFLDGILHLQDSRILSCLGIEHTDTIYIFGGEVDVLKYLLALATCTKGRNRNCHANKDSHECYDNI